MFRIRRTAWWLCFFLIFLLGAESPKVKDVKRTAREEYVIYSESTEIGYLDIILIILFTLFRNTKIKQYFVKMGSDDDKKAVPSFTGAPEKFEVYKFRAWGFVQASKKTEEKATMELLHNLEPSFSQKVVKIACKKNGLKNYMELTEAYYSFTSYISWIMDSMFEKKDLTQLVYLLQQLDKLKEEGTTEERKVFFERRKS